jgi:hypothetical protein
MKSAAPAAVLYSISISTVCLDQQANIRRQPAFLTWDLRMVAGLYQGQQGLHIAGRGHVVGQQLAGYIDT